MDHDTTERATILEEAPKKKRGRKKKGESVDPAAPVVVAVPKKKNYINNADLMKELAKSKERGMMTDELAKMLTMLCSRYAKHPDYMSIYSYDEDMKAFAMLTLVKVWKGFNPERTNNPFAYFTQIIRHAFYQYLNHERKQRDIKDNILVDMGEQPSFTYMENFRDKGEHDMGSEITMRGPETDSSEEESFSDYNSHDE